MPDIFEYHQGQSPVLLSFPHDGELLYPAVDTRRLTAAALRLPDTDWKIFQLYDFIPSMDISYVRAKYSRYVIDLNRPPDGAALYPDQATTTICPTATFDGADIYRAGRQPDPAEIETRCAAYWQPYHRHIECELERIKAMHGYAVLWDAHSIKSSVPRLFSGRLPDLNFGTADGRSCSGELRSQLLKICTGQSDYSFVFDGRFKGGYITRHYGRPEADTHAVQLELNQATYLSDPPGEVDATRHARVQQLLKTCIAALREFRRAC